MKNKIREYLYLMYYSLLVDPLNEIASLFNLMIDSIKKPKVWMYIALGIATYGAVTSKYTLMKVMLPIILFCYLLRQKIDGAYKRNLLNSDIKNNKDTDIVKKAYEDYKRKCFFSKTEALEYEQWKQREINKNQAQLSIASK